MALSGKNSPSRGTPLEYTRNFGIAAHIDAGKTTTSERILFYAGVIHKTGEVHEGAATTDWMEQEQERGITITSAAISCGWTTADGPFAKIPHRLNVIDTPGHVDFTAEVERSLRVLDGAVAVFCAVAGVQPQSETVWRQMNKYNVPRVAYINKMDRTGADFFNAVKGIREKLRGNAHPLYIPIGAGETFTGLVDLVKGCAYVYDESDPKGMKYAKTDVPADLKADYEKYRESLIEAVSDFDDTIAEKYLEGQEISSDELRVAIRKATLSLDFVGVIPGSSFKNKGVQMVLDAVVDYLPSPLDLPPMKAFKDDGETETGVEPDDNAKPVGLCFKLWSDPYVGQLVFFRLYRGTLKKGDSLYNPRTRKAERVSRLMIMKAMDREEIDTAYSGDICALIGPKEIVTGDTLCAREDDLVLEPPSFPEPVISMSIEPATKADQEKLSIGLQRLAQEDPTFRVSSDQETGQTIISGMGELHLDIIVDRLRREFKVDAKAGRPQISYRETITAPADGEGKFVRQSGGRGQYGHAVIKIEPNPGKGIEVLNEIVGGVIPRQYIPAIDKGIQESAARGYLAGCPVVDFKVRVYDGSYHTVDSSEMAFKMAGSIAFKAAMAQLKVVLLEPIVQMTVTIPDEYMGDVIGDLSSRRGKVLGSDSQGGITELKANVPMSEVLRYAPDLRSMTGGQGVFTMEFDHYEEAPQPVVDKVVAEHQAAKAGE